MNGTVKKGGHDIPAVLEVWYPAQSKEESGSESAKEESRPDYEEGEKYFILH